MKWTCDQDALLLKEIIMMEPYQFKKWTRERGNAWAEIAKTLNKLNKGFVVDQRGASERYDKIKK